MGIKIKLFDGAGEALAGHTPRVWNPVAREPVGQRPGVDYEMWEFGEIVKEFIAWPKKNEPELLA